MIPNAAEALIEQAKSAVVLPELDPHRTELEKNIHNAVQTMTGEQRVRILSLIHHFSLMCTDCDAGEEHATYDEAFQAGWKDIDYHDGPCWNFLGTCKDCAEQWFV